MSCPSYLIPRPPFVAGELAIRPRARNHSLRGARRPSIQYTKMPPMLLAPLFGRAPEGFPNGFLLEQGGRHPCVQRSQCLLTESLGPGIGDSVGVGTCTEADGWPPAPVYRTRQDLSRKNKGPEPALDDRFGAFVAVRGRKCPSRALWPKAQGPPKTITASRSRSTSRTT